MTRLLLIAAAVLFAACARGPRQSDAAASAKLAAAMAQSGVQCAPHDAGVSRSAEHHDDDAGADDGEHDGGDDHDGEHHDGGDLDDGGEHHRDGGDFDDDGGEHHQDGGDLDDDGGTAGDDGHHHDEDGGVEPGEHDGGDDLLPPAVIAACSGKAAGDSCAFTFEEHAFTGVCATIPNGTTLCAPLCGQ